MDNTSTAFYENMSVSLLARQPVTEEIAFQKPEKNWEIAWAQLEQGLSSDRNWRYSWWAYWARLAEYFLPRRYHWLIVANRMTKGNPINDSIIDSTGLQAVRTCASGLWTGLTSPSRPWFKIENALSWQNIDEAAKDWIEDTEKKVYAVLAQSNFYSSMEQVFEDVVVFGTAPLIIYEDFEDVIRLYVPCAGEYFLRCGSRLDINTFTREFTLTVQQIVDQFGIENCPPQVVDMWNQGGASLNVEYVVAHTISPNFAISKRGMGKDSFFLVPKKFNYKEIYWLKGMASTKPLSKRGFENKPFMVARWSTVSNDPYGRGPCMDALGDNKQLQRETLRKAEFIDKLVHPPMGANVELKNQPASGKPGGITYVDTSTGKKGFWPLFEVQPAALTPMIADIEKVSKRIQDCLFVNVFMAITQMAGVQPRNELELTKRDLERLQSLGPMVELFEQEVAGPAIRRIIEILDKKRLLKPKPPSLAQASLKISYISIMKIAQKSAQSVSIKDFLQTGGALSSAAKAAGLPDPLRIANLDKMYRTYAELNNVPIDCLFTDQEVQVHDQAREQAVAQQKAQVQAPQLAMAGVNAAKTLSETQVPGGSALGALLGGQQGA